jgi:hypothetical protein
VLQFLSGIPIGDEHDKTTLHVWLRKCVTDNHFLPATDNGTGVVDINANITPYVSSSFIFNPHVQLTELTELRSQVSLAAADKDPVNLAIRQIAVRVYRSSIATLKMCAFVDDDNALMSAMLALKDTDIDLRSFFGGLPLLPNSRQLMLTGSGINCTGMQSTFDGGQMNESISKLSHESTSKLHT